MKTSPKECKNVLQPFPWRWTRRGHSRAHILVALVWVSSKHGCQRYGRPAAYTCQGATRGDRKRARQHQWANREPSEETAKEGPPTSVGHWSLFKWTPREKFNSRSKRNQTCTVPSNRLQLLLKIIKQIQQCKVTSLKVGPFTNKTQLQLWTPINKRECDKTRDFITIMSNPPLF